MATITPPPFNSGQAASSIFQGAQGQVAPQGAQAPPAAGGSAIDQILAGLVHKPTTGENIADIGSVFGAFSSGEKANRTSYGNARQDYDRMMLGNQLAQNNFGLENQQQRNANESDALKKLQQSSYLADGGAHFQPPTFQLGGQQRTAPSFSFAPQAPSAATVQGAQGLQGQMLNRLQDASYHPDWSYKPADVDSYAKPGTAEKIGSYGALGLGSLGGIMEMLQRGQQAQGQQQPQQGGSVVGNLVSNYGGTASKALGGSGNLATDAIGGLSKLFTLGGSGSQAATSGLTSGLLPSTSLGSAVTGGSIAPSAGLGSAGGIGAAGSTIGNILGKAVPIAGAVTGGIGLLHNQGTKRNVLNGTQTGASIGTMVMPGIGTAVGAGIGALAGWARGYGAPSQQELEGRDTSAQGFNSLGQGATAQQLAEAQGAGWDKPEQALARIVTRDALVKQGLDPTRADAQADQMMKSIYSSEKKGSNAVGQAFSMGQYHG